MKFSDQELKDVMNALGTYVDVYKHKCSSTLTEIYFGDTRGYHNHDCTIHPHPLDGLGCHGEYIPQQKPCSCGGKERRAKQFKAYREKETAFKDRIEELLERVKKNVDSKENVSNKNKGSNI